jgi:hypothetical protein
VRLATEAYVEPTTKNLSQSMVHLTNYAINKFNPDFQENTNPHDAQDGHKRSWEAVQEFLRKEGHNVDVLLAEIEDLIVKTLISVQPSLSHFYHSCQPDDVENAMCFEVLGFDVILDHKLQPFLLEVNHAPSFATESELDRIVKEEVLRDTFTLLNLCPDARRQKKRDAKDKMESRIMGVAKKQSLEERVALQQEIALQRTAWEDERLNGYKRLYPSEQKEREYSHIYEAAVGIWEMLMGGNSRRSIRLSTEQDDPPDNEKRKSIGSEPAGTEHKVKRSAEEIRKVVERLSTGGSARPRTRGTAKERDTQNAAWACTESTDTTDGNKEEDENSKENSSSTQPGRAGLMAWAKVRVGDVVKVRTSLGWECVIVKAKHMNRKVDIQFRDGEQMNSVFPRLLRDTNGQPWIAPSPTQNPPSSAGPSTPSTPSISSGFPRLDERGVRSEPLHQRGRTPIVFPLVV